MQNCLTATIKDLTNSCQVARSGGLYPRAWALFLEDISFSEMVVDTTYGTLIETLVQKEGKKGFKIEGTKYSLNLKTEAVTNDNDNVRYKNTFSCADATVTAAAVESRARLMNNPLVFIVERRDTPQSEGKFVLVGLKNGLYGTTLTSDENTENGLVKMDYASLDKGLELYENYTVLNTDYNTTVTMLDALLVTRVPA